MDEQRRAELRKFAEKRLEDLKESGALLIKAAEIRALVAQVGAAVGSGSIAVSDTQLARWQEWALAQAGRMLPLTGPIPAEAANAE